MADAEVVVRLTRLRAELAIDRDALVARAAELDELLSAWSRDGSLPRPQLVLCAVEVHGWYTALETALERIARAVDQSIPTGPTWHIDLLFQLSLDVPGIRPAALPATALDDLHELRKFRHFFRNAYVLQFDPEKIRARALELQRAHASVNASLSAFDAHLAATVSLV